MTAHLLVKFYSGKRKAYTKYNILSLEEAIDSLNILIERITLSRLLTTRIVGAWID